MKVIAIITLTVIYTLTLMMVFSITFSNKEYSFASLEKRFGKLERLEPKSTFVHFKTVDGYQVDCIKNGNIYTYLTKSKLKE